MTLYRKITYTMNKIRIADFFSFKNFCFFFLAFYYPYYAIILQFTKLVQSKLFLEFPKKKKKKKFFFLSIFSFFLVEHLDFSFNE